MKTYHERTEDVLVKLEKKRKTRRVTRLAITVTVTVILALVLFLPRVRRILMRDQRLYDLSMLLSQCLNAENPDDIKYLVHAAYEPMQRKVRE